MFWRAGKGVEEGTWHGPAKILMIEGRNLVWVSHLTRLYRCAPEHLRKLSADEAQGVSRKDLQTFRLPDRSGTGVFQFRELSQQEPPPRTSITARNSVIESDTIVGQAISHDNNTPNVSTHTPPLSIAQQKKNGFSLYSSSSANTGVVQQRAKHLALRGWTSGRTIIMTHFSLSLLDSPATRGVLGTCNKASLFNSTRATAIRPFLFPRVPWVMEKVTVTRSELLRLLRTNIKYKKHSSNHLLSLNFRFLSVRRKAL